MSRATDGQYITYDEAAEWLFDVKESWGGHIIVQLTPWLNQHRLVRWNVRMSLVRDATSEWSVPRAVLNETFPSNDVRSLPALLLKMAYDLNAQLERAETEAERQALF